MDKDPVGHVKKLREEYERALDAAESRRSAYHEAVLGLHRGGTPLREIAKELGLSHQRVHQIVSGEPPRRRKLPRAAGGAAGMAVILAAATVGALRLAHAPPFTPSARTSTVSVPNVLNEPEPVAARRLTNAGLHVRVIHRERTLPPMFDGRVYAQSGPAGEHVARGSLVTLFVFASQSGHGQTGPAGPSWSAGPSGEPVAFRDFGCCGITHPPGGAVLRRKREVVMRRTPLEFASVWVAPDRVNPSAHCAWLQVGRAIRGGTCYGPPLRGLPEVVSLVVPVGGRRYGPELFMPVVWGRTGSSVAQLTVTFQDGTRVSLPDRDGMFLYPVPHSRWRAGHRPVSLVARDPHGRVVDKQPLYQPILVRDVAPLVQRQPSSLR